MVRKVGFYNSGTGQHQSNTVYHPRGSIPAVTTITGGGTQQIKVLKKMEKQNKRIVVGIIDTKGFEQDNRVYFRGGTHRHREPGTPQF